MGLKTKPFRFVAKRMKMKNSNETFYRFFVHCDVRSKKLTQSLFSTQSMINEKERKKNHEGMSFFRHEGGFPKVTKNS